MTPVTCGRAAALALLAAVLVLGGCGADTVDGRGAPAGAAGSSGQPDVARFADPAAAAAVLSDVRAGLEALNTYDYRSLAAARQRGLRYTTGTLTADYEKTFRTVLAKNAPSLHAVQRARMLHLGVTRLAGDVATLLGYGRLDVRTTSTPGGRVDPFAVGVRAQRVSGRWLLARVDTGGIRGDVVTGSTALRAAVTSARSTAAALSTFRRATFDADFARAVASVGGTLRADVLKNRTKTLTALRNGNFDLSATVTAVGVEKAVGTSVVVLTALDSYRVVNGSRAAEPTQQRLLVTVERQGRRWIVTDIESVGTS